MSRHGLFTPLKACCLAIGLGMTVPSFAFDAFVVKDIRLEGLARISAASVYSALPINAGETLDEARLNEAVKGLFKTGNFEDIQVARDGDVLVVNLTERPSIVNIDISGNKSIDKDSLLKGLKQSGLAEGEVFQRAMLDQVKRELERQYVSQGRYAAKVEVEVEPKPRNRVALAIKIEEGGSATIKGINFVGNEVFDDKDLNKVFRLRSSHFTSFFKNDDKYSREKLAGDLEALRSYYMDRGYVNFMVNSTQVTVTPDKKHVYVDVNLTEGEKYTIGTINLAGEVPVPEDQLKRLFLVKEGEVFSQQRVTSTNQLLTRRLGNDGYIFAEVQGVPELDEEKKVANLTFFLNPGKQAYVRRVNFRGNNKTDDQVLRREMRQFEGALASTEKIDLSKARLQRLGFFQDVKVETPRVAGVSDQVDVNVSVEEQPSGSIGASIGFSQGSGLIFSANVSQNNFMGSGNRVSVGLNRSDTRDTYNFSYVNPYFTLDGISRGYNLYYRKTKFDSRNVSNYVTDSMGGNISFSYPIDETENISMSVGIDDTSITPGVFVSKVVDDFIKAEGDSVTTYIGSLSWSRNTLNRGMFADRGASQTLGLEFSLPGSDVGYYKLSYGGQRYIPIAGPWVARAHGNLGYGGGYGDSSTLPFYKNYFAGGFGSVRGYRDNTLGPKSPAVNLNPDPDPEVIGGNVLVEAGVELIIPTPFAAANRQLRTVLFVDAGNVFDTENSAYKVDAQDMRYSAGIALAWLTAIGPLSFSLSQPFNDQEDDDTQVFQFSIGQGF